VHSLNPSVTAWLRSHHGAVTWTDLDRLGVSRHQINRLLRDGVLISHVRGVYRLAGAPRTPEQAAALACASGPDVVVSHISAGREWGFRRLGPDSGLHVVIAGPNHRLLPDVVVHRSHRVDPVDVVDRGDGIRFTSPPRTVFDLASILSDEQLESIIEQVLHDGRATIPTLIATAGRLRQRGRNGSARFGRVLWSRPAWMKPVESDLELQVERAIVEAGLPRPVRQHVVRLPNGEQFRLDFYWPAECEALEVDHVTWHGGKADLTADKRRDRLLRQLGIHTTRISDDDARQRMPAIVSELRAILDRSRARSVS
jgi:very-short-patch-repair endonuclease